MQSSAVALATSGQANGAAHPHTVSVIIPAYNAVAYLPQCIGALRSGSSEDAQLEIIVVDDTSSDETAVVAESLGVRVYRMDENCGPAKARNLGAGMARGAYLMFVDADVVVRPGAIDRIRELFLRNPSIAAVFGSYDAEPAAKGVVTEYKNLLHHYVHQNGRREASTFWTGCGAIRRDLFLEMGGFDTVTHPRCIEDIELGYRLREAGHSILLDRDLLCKHLKKWTPRSWIATDVFGRAIPWAQLILRRHSSPDDLNVKTGQKACVALAAIGLACLLLSWVSAWFIATSVLTKVAIGSLNLRLFQFLRAARGLRFALACFPLHWLYFVYSGLSFLYVWIALALHLEVRDGNSPPRVRATRAIGRWRSAALAVGGGSWWALAADIGFRDAPSTGVLGRQVP
jgi:GT2 family glycosyltransferase